MFAAGRFALRGDPKRCAVWCTRCPGKPADAVDVVNRRCDCGRGRPTFGLPGSGYGGARWCARCPARAAAAVDVVNRKCACGRTVPSLGRPDGDGKALWCVNCPDKPPDAVNLRAIPTCACGRQKASYALPGQPRHAAQWCELCPARPADAVNMVIKRQRPNAPTA